MKNIENLKLEELQKLLKQINQYKNLRKQLGTRGAELFKRELYGKNLFVVEYFSDKDSAYSISSSIYKKIFNIDVSIDEISFIKKEDIKGGIKVFFNDSMIDISFSRIEKLIK